MATDMFMIYQINDAEKNREYRCRSYAYQIEHGFMITTDNYEISYCAKASQGLFPAKIRENMESLNPDKFKIRKFGVSDVIAITAAGKTACTTSYLPNALQSAAKKEELTAASPPDVKIGTKKFSKKAKK